MLSSTTRPTAIANPAKLIKFNDKPDNPMINTPVNTLRGIVIPMIPVGLSVIFIPLINVGFVLIRKTKTAAIANKNPSKPSLSRLDSCRSTSGPSFCNTKTSTSVGKSLSSSKTCKIRLVTVTVLASGSLITDIVKLGPPLVREILPASAVLNSTTATSLNRITRRPFTFCGEVMAVDRGSKPIGRLLTSSRAPNS